MTYEDLLKQIHDKWHSNYERQDVFYIALRAVVELHSPEGQPTQQCRCCKRIYPCPTIHEIEKELK